MQHLKNLFLVLVLGGCPADWNRKDTALEAAAVTFTLSDMVQTAQITSDCQEVNPIIGECGQNIDYRLYFVTMLATEFAVSRLLPQDWRPAFIGAWAGAEGATVWDNWRNE